MHPKFVNFIQDEGIGRYGIKIAVRLGENTVAHVQLIHGSISQADRHVLHL
jgi:hypothetical protein